MIRSRQWNVCLHFLGDTFRVIKAFPLQLWLMFLVHCLDSFGIFAISSNLTTYLNRVYGNSDSQVNYIYTFWNSAMVVFGVPMGFLIDKIGLRRSLIYGSVLSLISKTAFVSVTNEILLLVVLLVGTTISAGIFGSAVDLSVARYSNSKLSRSLVFGFLYSSMNIGGVMASLGIDLTLEMAPGWVGYQLLFAAGALASAICTLIVVFYDERKEWLDEPEAPDVIHQNGFSADSIIKVQQYSAKHSKWIDLFKPRNIWDALQIVRERTFIQLFVFSIALTGVRTLFRFMETILVSYITRIYPTEGYGRILAINPTMIIFLTPIMSFLTARGLREYDWIVFGTLIGGLSPLWLILWREDTLWPVYLFLIQATIGESIWSPKVKQWIIKNSPKGKRGAYSGLLPLSNFGGGILTGPVNSILLDTYCPLLSSTLWMDENSGYTSSCQDMWVWVQVVTITSAVFLLIGRRWLQPKHENKVRVTQQMDTSLLEDDF